MKAAKVQRICLVNAFALAIAALVFAGFESDSRAQLGVRANDPTGFSIRLPRVQVIHSDNEKLPGASMHLQRRDPWLAYQLGHTYFQREWTRSDGVFSLSTPRPFSAAANSCAMCHNMPFRSAGFGGNIADPPGFGQNTPHLFGIGLVEMIAFQIRQQILARYDTNDNGFLDVPAETKGRRAIVNAVPGVKVDFGSLQDLDGDGYPGLNDVIKVTLVDGEGRPLPEGKQTLLIGGYDLALGFLSSTNGDHQLTSLRVFIVGVIQTTLGLAVTDQTVTNDSGLGHDRKSGDGWAEMSNAGAAQPYFPVALKDCEKRCLPVSGGEVDLVEWYLLNHPPPALGLQTEETRHGRELMEQFKCTECHVADWQLLPFDEKAGLAGDRRFFDLEVVANQATGKLQGNLHSLTDGQDRENIESTLAPKRNGKLVKNIFTDLRYHDVGERFYRYSYSNRQLYVNKQFRTSALWGVGSTAPYGSDGRSLTLDDVIRRHGGEALKSAQGYTAARVEERNALIAFLETLVLYQPDQLPTDINGDGKIDESFALAGATLGYERFWPELLFRVAPRYKGWTNDKTGGRYFSYELLNAREAYGRTLQGLIDDDGNGVPDLVDRSTRQGTTEGAASRRAP